MARSFNGSSDFGRNSNGIITAAPLTMACWGYIASATVTQNALMNLCNSGAGTSRDEFILYFQPTTSTSGTVIFGVANASAIGAATKSATYSVNNWFHFGGVAASTTSRTAYFSGSGGTVNTASRTPSGIDRFAIGKQDNTASNFWLNGGLAEIALWNDALTSSEMTSLAQGVSPLLIRPESLVAYWPLTGRYSPEIDPVGGFDLTLTGTANADHPRILMPRGRQIILPAASAPPAGNRRRRILLGAA